MACGAQCSHRGASTCEQELIPRLRRARDRVDRRADLEPHAIAQEDARSARLSGRRQRLRSGDERVLHPSDAVERPIGHPRRITRGCDIPERSRRGRRIVGRWRETVLTGGRGGRASGRRSRGRRRSRGDGSSGRMRRHCISSSDDAGPRTATSPFVCPRVTRARPSSVCTVHSPSVSVQWKWTEPPMSMPSRPASRRPTWTSSSSSCRRMRARRRSGGPHRDHERPDRPTGGSRSRSPCGAARTVRLGARSRSSRRAHRDRAP